MLSTLIFTWLHHQTFYKELQEKVVEPIGSITDSKTWADVGCSTGLLTRLAHTLGYSVVGYDINELSLKVARLLSWKLKGITYKNEDFHTLYHKYDVVSATSLLSVVEDKEKALVHLISLLKKDDATLIIIEPTQSLTVANVWKRIDSIKSFWYYKGLLLWAKAREGKAIDNEIFDSLESMEVSHQYYLEGMVCVTYMGYKIRLVK